MLLETDDLTKSFGGLVAVDGVNIAVKEGELRSVIGPNGAGKTTFFNLLTGVLRPTSGDIRFEGESVVGVEPNDRVKRGISRSFQLTNIFPELSIQKNVSVALQNKLGYGRNFWSNTDSLTDLHAQSLEILDRVDIDEDPQTTAAEMSHGEKRRLEVGIAIAQDPQLLLLDEPTAGMSKEETRELVEVIESLNDSCTIMLIEHDIDVVLELSDQITVLTEGSVIADGTPEEVTNDEDVNEAYIGGKV